MADAKTILIGKSETKFEELTLKLANRHGLVTGATGTGKTVTLQKLAEGFSANGVPVFTADIKGDLSGVSAMGNSLPPFVNRAKEIGVEYRPSNIRRCSGISSASRGTPSAPRWRRWARCCSPA